MEKIYDARFIDELRNRTDIKDMIGKYVELSHEGDGTYVGKCPFHASDDQTLIVNEKEGYYFCSDRHCGASGDVLDFLMRYHRVSLFEAADRLADELEISAEERKSRTVELHADEKAEGIKRVNAAAAIHYARIMARTENPGYDYISGRGIERRTMAKFGIGYASPKLSAYHEICSQHFDDESVRSSSLFLEDRNGKMRDRFIGRVVYPIIDRNGDIVGMGGRKLNDDNPRIPKYINSPETLAFDKSRILYGMHIAQNTKRGSITLCEGYMDVIAMHQAGFDNAVASLGTSLTLQQAHIIKDVCDSVQIAYDSDAAGRKAAKRAIDILKKSNLRIGIIDLSPYKDPDELIKAEGAEEMNRRMENARDPYSYEMECMAAELKENGQDSIQEMDRAFNQAIENVPEFEVDSYIAAYRDIRNGAEEQEKSTEEKEEAFER